MVRAGAHRDHRAALGQLGVAGELAGGADAIAAVDRGDRLLPGGRPHLIRVVVARRPRSRQAVASDAVLGQHQIEHGRDQLPADPHRRHAAADDRAAVGVAERRTWAGRQPPARRHGGRAASAPATASPSAGSSAPSHRSSGSRPTHWGSPAGRWSRPGSRSSVGVLLGVTEVGRSQEAIRRVGIATLT